MTRATARQPATGNPAWRQPARGLRDGVIDAPRCRESSRCSRPVFHTLRHMSPNVCTTRPDCRSVQADTCAPTAWNTPLLIVPVTNMPYATDNVSDLRRFAAPSQGSPCPGLKAGVCGGRVTGSQCWLMVARYGRTTPEGTDRRWCSCTPASGTRASGYPLPQLTRHHRGDPLRRPRLRAVAATDRAVLAGRRSGGRARPLRAAAGRTGRRQYRGGFAT